MASPEVVPVRDAVIRILSEEREARKRQEWRARCYAEVLALYAHRLAVAQGKNPATVMIEARSEVQTRLKEKGWME